MASITNLAESSFWETGIQQIERTDKWDAGVSGSGIANRQGKQLANRTKYLKDALQAGLDKINLRQHYQISYTDQTITNNTVKFAKGTTYNLLYPLGDWDYTTPNDGVTRDYIVTLQFTVGPNFTYSTSAAVALVLMTTTSGPTYTELARCTTFQPGNTVMSQRKITLGPNIRVIGSFNVGNVGASVNISNALFRIEQVIV